MQFKDRKRRRPTLNITSLIDVMFILLIFFMVSSSFIEQPGMKLELPTIQSNEVERVENLVIYLSRDQEIFLGEKRVPLENLADEITVRIPNIREKTLILKADQQVPHGLVVKVMDTARRCGLTKIVIGAKTEQEP
ncbi:MAG: biopolymer transporter ExbD [candidate division KSB1 bacterium]|nr:biopolymer transporter ExbD [candidate division KSB1 bacterium]MDZ7345936.1 biopolymer transporter ExbD [candidate division KSB1 bacterium]